ncbi:PaaI family thioesterase [Raoultibacter massiliensis]|uniref:PaaI family thioesterase n=1 Tax=Raoultibacter massiliensis TaxID=1852371 RepID=A0ABV1JAA4_9ACTN|nr:PaaI family thioesterase [Raoultibacter massiliensis]
MNWDSGFIAALGIEFTETSATRIVATMPITAAILQPHGFVHGGATIALLESVASAGAEQSVDLALERPFGIDVHVRHRKSGVSGTLTGVAELDRVERSKQYWRVTAFDDAGDVVSDGVIVTKIVSLARLAEKEREREAAKDAR